MVASGGSSLAAGRGRQHRSATLRTPAHGEQGRQEEGDGEVERADGEDEALQKRRGSVDAAVRVDVGHSRALPDPLARPAELEREDERVQGGATTRTAKQVSPEPHSLLACCAPRSLELHLEGLRPARRSIATLLRRRCLSADCLLSQAVTTRTGTEE